MASNPTRVLGMTHLNGNLLAAVLIETTGHILEFHEICQISIVPIDYNLERVRGILPFHCDICPRHIDRINTKTMSVTMDKMKRITTHGLKDYIAADLLEKWFDRFELNRKKRIAPLSYNWPRLYSYICTWLGQDGAEYVFDYRYRDLLPMSLFLNDYYDRRIDNVPFAKNDFYYLLTSFNIERIKGRGATTLTDCAAMIELYRLMMGSITFSSKTELRQVMDQENLEDKHQDRLLREQELVDATLKHCEESTNDSSPISP